MSLSNTPWLRRHMRGNMSLVQDVAGCARVGGTSHVLLLLGDLSRLLRIYLRSTAERITAQLVAKKHQVLPAWSFMLSIAHYQRVASGTDV